MPGIFAGDIAGDAGKCGGKSIEMTERVCHNQVKMTVLIPVVVKVVALKIVTVSVFVTIRIFF